MVKSSDATSRPAKADSALDTSETDGATTGSAVKDTATESPSLRGDLSSRMGFLPTWAWLVLIVLLAAAVATYIGWATMGGTNHGIANSRVTEVITPSYPAPTTSSKYEAPTDPNSPNSNDATVSEGTWGSSEWGTGAWGDAGGGSAAATDPTPSTTHDSRAGANTRTGSQSGAGAGAANGAGSGVGTQPNTGTGTNPNAGAGAGGTGATTGGTGGTGGETSPEAGNSPGQENSPNTEHSPTREGGNQGAMLAP